MDSTHLHKWFLLLMLATLALLGLAAYREATPRWRAHQERYLSLTKDASFKPGIQQVMIEDLGRVDRCTTCHLGIDDPAMQGALQPLTRHPGNYLDTHPTEKFGCTVCHGGQGMATTHEGSAHGDLPFWRDPMPRKGLLDYRCGACHASKKVPGAPHLTRGRLLLRSKGCFGCHQIPSYEDERPHAPSLFSERIGQKTTRRWLRAWLQDPYAQYKRSKMPRYRFKAGEIKALTEYLFSLQGDPLPQAADSRGDPDQGKVVLRTSRCVSCHTINGKGGGMGPDLSRVGSKIRPAWLHTFLRDPHQLLPHSLMLAFRFSEQEVDDLVAYLSTELIDDDAPEISEVEEPPVVSKLARRGEDLYRFFGCGNCHPDGQGRTSPKVGPELAGIGTRDAAKLSFGRHHNVRLDMTNWIFLKVKDPRTPGGKVKMPTFRLSDAEVADLTIALMATTKSSIPPGRIRGTEVRPVWNPQGEFGRLLRRYRCFSCHQVRGHGGTLSTAPLDREGSEVQRAWLKSYLMVPYAIRVNLVHRMPRFRMTEQEAELMATYISAVLVDDTVPENLEIPASAPRAGARLYRELGCEGCHILDEKGGYVGPDLGNTGLRLRSGWVYSFLRYPQKYRPWSAHPDYGLNEKDALSLTGFLMSQRDAKTEGGAL